MMRLPPALQATFWNAERNSVSSSPLAAFQIVKIPFALTQQIKFPHGEKPQNLISLAELFVRFASSDPVVTSHNVIVPSTEPDMTCVESGENEQAVIFLA